MGPLSQPWVWARLPGHTVPSPGLAGLARLRGFHPQLAEDRALWVSSPSPTASAGLLSQAEEAGREKDPI